MDVFIEILKNAPPWVILLLGLYWFLAQIFPSIRIKVGTWKDEIDDLEREGKDGALIREYKEIVKQLCDSFGLVHEGEKRALDRIMELFQENNNIVRELIEEMKELSGKVEFFCDENNDMFVSLRKDIQNICLLLEKVEREIHEIAKRDL